MTAIDRDANILGALAVIVTDRTGNAVAAAAGHSLSAAVALSALHHFLDRPTVDALGRVLGLSPSGAVRLVDRLAADGLVTRGPGADGRSRSLTLTPARTRTSLSRPTADWMTVTNRAWSSWCSSLARGAIMYTPSHTSS